MRHALFVVFHYPPEASSSGVLRTLKYTRYLPEHGWRTTVLTLNRDAYEVTDSKLERQIPEQARVIRTRYLNAKTHLSLFGIYPPILAVPDRWIGWYPWAVAAGRRALREDPFDLVYSTSPVATAHLIGRSLARSARVPLVTDFRDPWYEEPPEPGTPGVVHWFAPRLERRVIAAASHVVTSTTHLRDMLQARYREQPADKFTAILNGYDEADFAALPAALARNDGRMLVVHAGNINPEFRDPRPLFRAARTLADQGRIDASRLLFRFIGGGAFGESGSMRQCLAETGLRDSVEFLPRVPYEAALQELARADLLLLLQASDDTVGLVPAKLYEYLRAQKPVLALLFPGATGEVLKQTGGGWAVNPGEVAELERVMGEAFARWSDGSLAGYAARLAVLRQFDRRTLTAKLAGLFNALAR